MGPKKSGRQDNHFGGGGGMTPEFFKISEPPSWRAVAGVCYNCTAEPRLELLGSSFEIKSEAPRNCYRYDTTWRGFMGPKNRYHPTTGTVLRAFLIPWSGFPPIEAPLVILLSDSCDNRHKQLGFGHLDHPPRSLARRQAFNALSSSYPWHALVN